MENVARRYALRHPAIERFDHRKIEAVAHAVEAEPVRKHGGRHQPRKRTHFFFRQPVYSPRRIRRVQAFEITARVKLTREIVSMKRAGTANADLHEASARPHAVARPDFGTPLNSKIRSSAGANTRS